jgi:hypothetical protein
MYHIEINLYIYLLGLLFFVNVSNKNSFYNLDHKNWADLLKFPKIYNKIICRKHLRKKLNNYLKIWQISEEQGKNCF